MANQDLEFRQRPATEVEGGMAHLLKQLHRLMPKPPPGRTVVIGAGAEAVAMAHLIELHWPATAQLSIFGPREHGEEAAQRVLRSVQGLSRDDLVICLIGSDGTELFDAPVAPLTRSQKQYIAESLIKSEAAQEEIACVHKHLCLLKGGRLAAACAPARVVTLVASSQSGVDPGHFAGGPTLPDPSTCNDALAVIQRYRIDVPTSILSMLVHGEIETPKPTHPCFALNEVRVLGAN